MTSHKGPPAHLAGPFYTAPSYGTTPPSSRPQMQSYHGALPSDIVEPAPKRQRVDDTSQRPPSKALGTNPPAASAESPLLLGSDGAPAAGDSNPLPSKQCSLFPIRPGSGCKSRSKQQGTALAIERAATRHTVQTKAYVAEPPASAPRYQNSGPADFFPWTGHHAEDVLNELTTRNGFYDKLPASQNESLTARPSILSSLKNKSGLQILSSVFASALDQRQTHGRITVGSTFKPPPRVTLTDTKKEAWLRDLANPSIPLRRLSRTIPHGIRGRILLDHCLSKDIPISRAIWLVKCVGANEIRACKRKGTGTVFAVGGEAKWIQDWTSAVEHFLETIIDSCGSEHWKARLNYGLRLISHVYAEGLLDHDQYSKWLVDRLATCDLDNVPLWLLIVNIHKPDLLRCRQHGRHLVEALLSQMHSAQKPATKVVYDFVLQELVKECKALMASHPECFLLPRSWKASRDIIQDYVVGQDAFLERLFKELSLRNQRLEDRAVAQGAKACSSAEQTVVAALDSLAKTPNYPKVAGACLRASLSSEALVDTCIQWASSTYRYGQFRVYAAARLLRIWSRHSIHLQSSVSKFLARSQDIPDIDQAEVYRLCAELVSSKHLSVGRYLQWVMASGALHKSRKESPGDPGDVRLLCELPLQGLPIHTLNLRRSLLSSLGTTGELETKAINVTKAQIAGQLPRLFPMISTPNGEEWDSTLSSLSRTLKSELAWWIRNAILAPHQRERAKQELSSTQETTSQVTREEFHKLRQIFEDLQEYRRLADVLLVLAKATKNEGMLAEYTDTVNFHFRTFDALGVAKDLFNVLFSQRKLVPTQDGTETSATHGLIDLATRLPGTGSELRRLRKDEISLDPKQSAAAPSPISDNMVEAVHSDTPTFFEEMDQILTNGTSMDQPTLARCFGAITGHLATSWNEAIAFPCRYPELLARLRAFDPISFDVLAAKWLDTLTSREARPRLSTILVPMICHKVCTLNTVVDRACKLSQDSAAGHGRSMALEVLEMLSSVQNHRMPSVEYRIYRFLHQQQSILQTHPESLVFLVRRCILEAKTIGGPLETQAKQVLGYDSVKSFIRMVLSQASTGGEPFPPQDTGFSSALKDILSQESPEFSKLSLSQMISRLLDNLSNFNSSLSLSELQNTIDSTSETAHDSSDVLTKVLMEKLEYASPSQVTLWSCIISSLGAACASSIHGRAKEAILSRIDDGQMTLPDDSNSTTDRLMEMVVATSSSIPDAVALTVLEQISERLHKLVSSPSIIDSCKAGSAPESDKVAHAVDTLLRLLTVHQAAILNPKFPQSTLSRICLSLATLYMHLTALPHRSLTTYIADVLAIVSDALSPDTRSRCIDALSTNSQALQHPSLSFIFRDANTLSAATSLQLVSKPAPGSTAMTRQPFPLRRWELVQDATPVMTENDTGLSLTLFGARRAVLL